MEACTARKELERLSDEGEKQWGTWLRAEIPRRSSFGDDGGKDRRTNLEEFLGSNDG